MSLIWANLRGDARIAGDVHFASATFHLGFPIFPSIRYTAPMFCSNVWTFLKEFPGWLIGQRRGERTVTFLRHREALGDTLMVTALARSLKRLDPQLRVGVVSRRPEIFQHNPNIDENRGWHLWRGKYTVQAGYRRCDLAGQAHAVQTQWNALWTELAEAGFSFAHTTTSLPELDGVNPEVFLTDAERQAGHMLGQSAGDARKPLVLIGSGGKLKPTHNREWGLANYQSLVDLLAPHARLIQISGEQPLRQDGRPLPNLGLLPIREAAALFQACDVMLVQEGGLMHLARAVNAPAVVIYGGYVFPELTGYRDQVNLSARPACAPCIREPENCLHLKCMNEITPRRVLTCMAKRMEERRGLILPQALLDRAPARWEPPDFVDRKVLGAELARGV